MKINDQREIYNKSLCFKELDIGEVYEDENGYICIKTTYADDIDEINCIAFINGEWATYHQDLDSKVIRVYAELVLKR